MSEIVHDQKTMEHREEDREQIYSGMDESVLSSTLKEPLCDLDSLSIKVTALENILGRLTNKLEDSLAEKEEYLASFQGLPEKIDQIMEEFNSSQSIETTSANTVTLEAGNNHSRKESELQHNIDEPEFRRTYLLELLNSVNLPGVRYISGQSKLHGVVWIFIHLSALLISYVYIKDAYDTWQSSPIVQTLSNKLMSHTEIPFPAVTICFTTELNSSYNVTKNIEKCLICNETAETLVTCTESEVCDPVDIIKLNLALKFCSNSSIITKKFKYNNYVIKSEINSVTKSLAAYMEKILPSCESLPDFRIKTFPKSYSPESGCNEERLQWFLSGNNERPLCMTFNSLRYDDIYRENVVLPLPLSFTSVNKRQPSTQKWTLENIKEFGEGGDSVPVYNISNMVFIFSSDGMDKYYDNLKSCVPKPDEVSLYVHSPSEIPLMKSLHIPEYSKSKRHSYVANVSPNLIISNNDLADYHPTQRGCYYSHEKELSIFKFYSKSNCEVECLVNCSLATCGCIYPYNFPQPNDSVAVCLQPCKLDCDCKCLPDCNSLTYDITEVLDANYVSGNVAAVIIKDEFYPFIRYSVNNLSEFVAYSLGLLGTFNGFSVMILFEMAYVITARLWVSVNKTFQQNV